MADHKKAFLAELETQKAAPALMRADGETVELGVFQNTILNYIKSIARQQIDTEEERDAIKEMILTVADNLVAPTVPWGWQLFIRPNLDHLLDEAMDKLPDLLANAAAEGGSIA